MSEPLPSSRGRSSRASATSSTRSSGGTAWITQSRSGAISVRYLPCSASSFLPNTRLTQTTFARVTDIKVTAGLQVGIASATLCINRRLAIISSVKRAAVSTKDRRRSLWIDITIVVVPPVVVMIVSYCVQATRFTVQEAMGCGVATSTEVAAVLGLYVPPLLIGLISFGYGGQCQTPQASAVFSSSTPRTTADLGV
jgi:hypothetical protein